MMQTDDLEQHLQLLFLPNEAAGRVASIAANSRFVHYSSAESAMNILRSKQMWMRNSLYMNDFMEIRHGRECVRQFIISDVGRSFMNSMDAIYDGFSNDLGKRFDGWLPSFQTNTYMISVSKHLDKEDRIGRLSMWRAYGGTCGVALVLNNTPLMASTAALKVYSSPVLYCDPDSYVAEMASVVRKISEAKQVLASAGYERVMTMAFTMLRLGVLCTKHPGFDEEQEWRIYYDPSFEKSPVVDQTVESIVGTPQLVQKIPLKHSPTEGLFGADIPNLIERVIVGPTQHPWAVYEAFVELLRQRGVTDAQDRVIVSDIPLRQ